LITEGLALDQGLALGSIGGSNLGSAWNSTIESFTARKAVIVLWVVVILPVDVYVWIKIKTHFAKSVTLQLNYLVRRGPFLIELSQEFSPTEQNEQDQ
jgi:hypothetical protein